MEAGDMCSVNPRLKREDCKRTKHDPNFSDWKILIGPSDWEDYSQGKEGSAKYRIHNLPLKSGPGVYELGIAVSRSGLGREVNRLDPNRIVVVYLGQADNVRTRLQQYGRTGAHLGNNTSTYSSDDCNPASIQKGQGVFEEILSKGYPVIYRWAPMKNKEDAKKTESQLLNGFDYAWNTSNNGTRRSDDILRKLSKIASGSRTFSNVDRVLLPFTQKPVGIQIESSKPHLPDDKLRDVDKGRYNFLPGVFKFNRTSPRIVQDITSVIQENTTRFCGVALEDGSVCRRPPVERRLRCSEHKGMRVNGSTAKTIGAMKSENILDLESNVHSGSGYGEHFGPRIQFKCPLDESITNTTRFCGVAMEDGSVCRRPPVERRLRCSEHKGMRVNGSTAKTIGAMKSENILDLESNVHGGSGYGEHFGPRIQFKCPLDESITNICGIILNDGSRCRRQPVKGRKRCHEHKGRRILVSYE